MATDWMWCLEQPKEAATALDHCAAENKRLREGMKAAAYALFEIKRMQPDAIKAHAAEAHEKACAVLDAEPHS